MDSRVGRRSLIVTAFRRKYARLLVHAGERQRFATEVGVCDCDSVSGPGLGLWRRYLLHPFSGALFRPPAQRRIGDLVLSAKFMKRAIGDRERYRQVRRRLGRNKLVKLLTHENSSHGDPFKTYNRAISSTHNVLLTSTAKLGDWPASQTASSTSSQSNSRSFRGESRHQTRRDFTHLTTHVHGQDVQDEICAYLSGEPERRAFVLANEPSSMLARSGLNPPITNSRCLSSYNLT